MNTRTVATYNHQFSIVINSSIASRNATIIDQVDGHYQFLQIPRTELSRRLGLLATKRLNHDIRGCSDATVHCTLAALGDARALFSVDHPYESAALANDWIASADIMDVARRKTRGKNAAMLPGIERSQSGVP